MNKGLMGRLKAMRAAVTLALSPINANAMKEEVQPRITRLKDIPHSPTLTGILANEFNQAPQDTVDSIYLGEPLYEDKTPTISASNVRDSNAERITPYHEMGHNIHVTGGFEDLITFHEFGHNTINLEESWRREQIRNMKVNGLFENIMTNMEYEDYQSYVPDEERTIRVLNPDEVTVRTIPRDAYTSGSIIPEISDNPDLVMDYETGKLVDISPIADGERRFIGYKSVDRVLSNKKF